MFGLLISATFKAPATTVRDDDSTDAQMRTRKEPWRVSSRDPDFKAHVESDIRFQHFCVAEENMVNVDDDDVLVISSHKAAKSENVSSDMHPTITKTRLFKYMKTSPIKTESFQITILTFSYFYSKHR